MNNNLLQYFDQTVTNNANKVAVNERNNDTTFLELQSKAVVIANEILKLTKVRNKPIAIFIPKSTELIIADIGVMYASNIFMNLDVNTPIDRLKNIFQLINPEVLISDTKNLDTLINHFDRSKIVLIDKLNYDLPIDRSFIDTRLLKQIDLDPWCIINTSGSTGTPKGVTLSHRNYLNYTTWSINEFNFNGSEILGVLSPPYFDHFNFEMCLMMIKGSTLVLLDNSMAAFPLKLLEVLDQKKINFIFWVPTIMVNIANLDLLPSFNLSELRMIWFAGEVFPTKQFNYWRNKFPNSTFVNLYGPTEITVDCTFYKVNRILKDSEPIPIGYACKNTDVFILTEGNVLPAKGNEGELCVRGTSLALGYYNNWQKTQEVFIQNPLNKNYPELIYRTGDIVYINEFDEIVYKGRKDGYIKHLGYRIELGEIEHVIVNVLQLVKNCCVVYNTAKKEITTIYESHDHIEDSEFRRKLRDHFPKYMIPSKYIRMNELPRNTNGKIDRLSLKNSVNEKQ
ncbi:MAG: AMP-binding protein [Chitinophagaceae bacterium]|nr:AMP-binding protein [Chitinophagaceae bacterium]MCA6511682.1 AMP-binding protein [Chitinophagaceae bacterium]